MLTIKTYLAPSSINGIGLFAAESIEKGAVVWRFEAGLDTYWRTQDADRCELHRQFLRHYSLIDKGMFVLCGDSARFINHSDDPNTTMLDPSVDDTMIARRAIAPHEELTENYFETETDYPF